MRTLKLRSFLSFMALILCSPVILSCCTTETSSNDTTDNSVANPSDYRESMRTFIIGLSEYAKSQKNNFIVIPQNGQEVAWAESEFTGTYTVPSTSANASYLAAIDGTGREDTFYGYTEDGSATDSDVNAYFTGLCDVYKNAGKTILSIDYCCDSSSKTNTASAISSSCTKNNDKGYISFASTDRELTNIPADSDYSTTGCFPYNSNTNNITSLSDAKNFLYILNPSTTTYTTRSSLLTALKNTDYDVIIMDAFYDASNNDMFTSSEIDSLKTKADGDTRLVIAYMSIGEAESYRYYWQKSWKVGSPSFIAKENPDWAGNYKVKYWYPAWQNIIYGNSDSYLEKIINAGFDGVYLDIVDAFEYFE